jgi:nucleotidyltransferase substrate binding protein (TIGR01987 family)
MDKIAQARQALATLTALQTEPFSVVVRDATIQRFEYTSEACWKALQAALRERLQVDLRFPKACYDAAYQAGWIDEKLCAALNRALTDRNLTSHTYHQSLADAIFRRIPAHVRALRRLLEKLDISPPQPPAARVTRRT